VRRRLFNLAAAASFLLLIAVAALWMRARWWWIVDGAVLTEAPSADGMIVAYRVRNSPFGTEATRRRSGQPLSSRRWEWISEAADASDSDRIPVLYFRSVGGHGGEMPGVWWVARQKPDLALHQIYVRHRTLALLTAILPAMWAVGRWRRRRTVAAGRCRKCGYDLRATPDRCPECGAAAAAVRVTP
jgi:hypothetical protein